MNYDPKRHHRRSIRKDQFDYTNHGGYFVTICTNNKCRLFGTVHDHQMHLNDAGRMIIDIWNKLPDKFPGIELNEFVIMPNHLHGIIVISNVGAIPCGCPNPASKGRPHRVDPTLGDIVGWFKTMTTNKYIHAVKQNGWLPFDGRLWQRNYYDRITRDDEWERIASYIIANPAQWHTDRENPHATPPDRKHPWQT